MGTARQYCHTLYLPLETHQRRQQGRRTLPFSHHARLPTPFVLRPVLLWKPINWLLSNCLSFRGRPRPGPSVQTHRPSRGDSENTREPSTSKAHICLQAEETQPARGTPVERELRTRRQCKVLQSNKTVYIDRFPPSTSPALRARWYWNVAERQAFGRTLLFCFFLLTRTAQPNDL